MASCSTSPLFKTMFMLKALTPALPCSGSTVHPLSTSEWFLPAPGSRGRIARHSPNAVGRIVTMSDTKGLKKKLFQGFTSDFGHPKLREHLAGVTMLLKYSPTLEVFKDRLDIEYPQWGKTDEGCLSLKG
jgi:hypothetical protein